MSIEFLSALSSVLITMIAGVNIITEVLKAFWLKDEADRRVCVFVVSVVLSFVVMYAYCHLASKPFTPLLGIGALSGGFLVSYGAMFGYDNLYGNFIKAVEEVIKGERK